MRHGYQGITAAQSGQGLEDGGRQRRAAPQASGVGAEGSDRSSSSGGVAPAGRRKRPSHAAPGRAGLAVPSPRPLAPAAAVARAGRRAAERTPRQGNRVGRSGEQCDGTVLAAERQRRRSPGSAPRGQRDRSDRGTAARSPPGGWRRGPPGSRRSLPLALRGQSRRRGQLRTAPRWQGRCRPGRSARHAGGRGGRAGRGSRGPRPRPAPAASSVARRRTGGMPSKGPQEAEAGLLGEGGHGGEAGRATIALAAHQHGLGLVRGVVAEQEMQDAVAGAGGTRGRHSARRGRVRRGPDRGAGRSGGSFCSRCRVPPGVGW